MIRVDIRDNDGILPGKLNQFVHACYALKQLIQQQGYPL